MEAFLYLLANLAPLAPMALVAGAMIYWLRSSRGVWIATGLIALCVPGIILTWFVRGIGFNAFGETCSAGQAREFMETMQLVFLAQVIAGFAGVGLLGSLAVRKHVAIGALLATVLAVIAAVTRFAIYVAAGMTAVDGYRC